MNYSPSESKKIAEEIRDKNIDIIDKDVVLFPPFTSLYTLKLILEDSPISLGAQNMHWEEKGAYTGEISGLFLKDLGCRYVIVGHSERRRFFAETDDMINKKLLKAFELGLTPVLCIGESLNEKEDGRTFDVLRQQFRLGTLGLKENPENLIIAYEPVWAIGTGKAASPEIANAVNAFIRDQVEYKFGVEVAESMRIIYGGSVNSSNAPEFMKQSEVDGLLVGSASLSPEEFTKIVRYSDYLKNKEEE